MSNARLLLLIFGVTQAVLYSSLLPLWEGFDEAWHYGYVQHFVAGGGLPVLGKTPLSQEVWDSLQTVPVSHVVQSAWPELQTFDTYFRLTPEARAQERHVLETVPRDGSTLSTHANYEIQQAPLAYALLAIPGYLLRNLALPGRILWLRIFNAVLCVAGTFLAAGYLFRIVGLPESYSTLGIFCLFACQMYWATTAHIASDGIALALSIWYFGALAAFCDQPGSAMALRLGLVTALGLLAKAYFLPLAALALCLVALKGLRMLPAFGVIPVVLAGPWYARNLILYHSLSGLLMANAGISPRQVFTALLKVDWTRTLPYMLRATLWTGNNSFTNFGTVTINCLLVLLAGGVILYARRPKPVAWSVLAAIATLSAAVIYVVGNDVLLLHGASAGASPWYIEPLLAPVLALSLLGMSRSPRIGRPLGIATCVLWMYICIATYLAKLIPLYGGYTEGRSTLSGLFHWYATNGRELTGMLSTISLAPPALIYFETAAVSGLAVVLAFMIALRLNMKATPSDAMLWLKR
jgi:hypothetical protein